MRRWFVIACLSVACVANSPPPPYYGGGGGGGGYQQPDDPELLAAAQRDAITRDGKLDDRTVEFVFDGGQLEFEMYRLGNRIVQTARSRYAVPVMVSWSLSALENLRPVSMPSGVIMLPPATQPLGMGPIVVLAELEQEDRSLRYRRELAFRARFGDPGVQPTDYQYALPFPRGQTFSVLQGFHGAFSHHGSNEFAVDFDCPVATPVLAARPGMVVVVNAKAQGSGTTPDFLDYNRTNFVIVMHDDGTLGEYMHLAPATVQVKPGQRVERGQELALSGNTGFSSTPHLHFQVMTAARDGIAARSFPFIMAVAPGRAEEPTLSQRYTGWETRADAPPMR
jgi:murein DD-endopeptidase MepM/ murein hydrolase activator NlpD